MFFIKYFIVNKILSFIFTFPLRIYKYYVRRGTFFLKAEAIKIVIIYGIITFALWLYFGLLGGEDNIWRLLMGPAISSALGVLLGYQYLTEIQ